MSTVKQYITLGIVALIFVAAGLLLYFVGIKSHNIHYVRLEVNPKVEILTNRNNVVTHIMGENEAGKEVLMQEKFVGLKIEEACKKFIDLCVKANYIDIEKHDNAVQITVVSGAMQSLEQKVFESLNNYFLENQIFAIISENDNDLASIKDAKEKNVTNVNKLTLINSVINAGSDLTFEELNKLNESRLLEMLKDLFDNQNENENQDALAISSTTRLANKSLRIDQNRVRLQQFLDAQNDESKQKFAEEYDDFKKLNTANYDVDFEEKYVKWANFMQ